MAPIDDKVVAMSFEHGKFEAGVKKTILALEKLKSSLKFDGAGKGFEQIDQASKKVDLSHISRGVETVSRKLEALRLIAIGVLSRIAYDALAAGTALVKAFTIDPLKAGFAEYSTNLNSIQTILANTESAGTKLKDVNAALLQLNQYSDKTIYNFSQMARNIGTFTAAGVDLKTSVGAIKGIANLAALSGSNAEQASTAMYQLSQAISAGSVKLQDWNSVVNAGMGGTVFQRALAQTAESMGTLKKGTVQLTGPMKNVTIAGEAFRQSLSTPGKASWLTSGVLTATLKQFTGDLKDADLAAMGFNETQIKAIQKTAKTAMHAATEVKTIAQVLDVAKETAGSGWAQTFQIIFGTFTEAKKTFTNLSEAINGFINKSADARNKVLGDWKKLGGRTVLIDSIKIAFKNLGKILAPIKEAFRDIFPAKTGKDLFKATKRFEEFAKALKPSKETVENLKRTFRGLFAILSIGKQIIGGIFTVFGRLFGVMGDGSGSFLNITGNIGDFLVALDEALKKGNSLHKFFVGLGDILVIPLKLFNKLTEALSNLFDGFSPGGFSDKMNTATSALTPFQKVLEAVGDAFSNFADKFDNIGQNFGPVLKALGDGISGIGVAIGKALSGTNFEAILQVIQTGLFGGLVLMFRQFLGRGSFLNQISKGFGRGIIANIAGTFSALQGSMKGLQRSLNAKALKDIAIAIALLVLSVVALSFVDPKKLKSAIVALGFVFAELLIAMGIMDKIGNSRGFLKMPFIGAALITFAVAIDLLTVAVIALSLLSWEELLKGLGGVAVLLGAISVATIPLSANAAGLIRASIGITAIAVAINILALAVRQFGSMNLPELGKGLGSVAISLGIIAAAMHKMPVITIKSTLGIVALAVALKILASAIGDLGRMNLINLGKGLGAIAFTLGAIALAMKYMPKTMIATGAGLILVATAMKIIASAIKSMGGMSVEEIAKGLITLAGSLWLLTGALYGMEGGIAGALALGITAAGMALLAPALIAMGKQSWKSIIKGMVTLAASLTILGIAGVAIAGAVPALLGLGAALVLIGGGLALAGAGVFLVGAGLSAIAVSGTAAVGILVAAITELTESLVENAKLLILGLLEIVRALAATAPKFAKAIVKILNVIIDLIIKASPKLVEAFEALLDAGLQIFYNNKDQIIKAGFDLIISLLEGVKREIPKIVDVVADIIVRFLDALAENLGKIVSAGANILVSLLKGIANNIAKVITAGYTILTTFISSIGNNINRVITAGANVLVKFLEGLGKNIKDVVVAGGVFISKVVEGIGQAGKKITTAARETAISFITHLSKEIVKLVDQVATAVIDMINAMADVVEKRAPEFRAALMNLGGAIIKGITAGLTDPKNLKGLYDQAKAIGKKLLGFFHLPWDAKSPSRVMVGLGKNILLGLHNGLGDTTKLYKIVEDLSYGLLNTFKDIFEITSPSKAMYDIGQQITEGFAKGLVNITDVVENDLVTSIKNSFTTLASDLKTEIENTLGIIASERDKIKSLKEGRTSSADSLADERDRLAALIETKKADAAAIAEQRDTLKQLTEAKLKDANAISEAKARLDELIETEKRDTKAVADQQKIIQQLTNGRVSDAKAIAAAEAIISKNKDTLAKLSAAHRVLTKDLQDEKKELIGLANSYQKIADKLDAANDALTAAIRTREDAVKNFTDKYSTLPDIVTEDAEGKPIDQLAKYMEALQFQADAVTAYQSTLDQLRALGLDDVTYQKLLEEGTADQQFADALLAGGKTAVDSLNTLDKQLVANATKLAISAGDGLYAAGISAAKKLVKSLEDSKDSIRIKMEEIADIMINALKKKLKQKSPSEAFAEIGRFSMAGLAKGISESSKMVTDAIDNAADDAISAMAKSMHYISEIMSDEIDSTPVITPVLDLTLIRNQSRELVGLAKPSVAPISLGLASIISSGQSVIQEEQAAVSPEGTSVTFEQNNYSPKALSEIDIYRQTRNQLSQIKSVIAS